MKRWLRSIIDVRKGEVLVTTLMVLNIYLILVTYYLLKPARDSLFIAQSGAKNLPLVFILIAVVVVPVTTIYSRISRSFKLNQLINYTTVFIIVNLVFLRWLITIEGQDWVVYAFYTWVSIYGVLTTSQFWLLANGIYDATQAKRIFVLFSLAAIFGASTGGEITSLLVKSFSVSTENLLFFCMAFMAICIGLVNWIWSISDIDVSDSGESAKKKAEEPEATMGEVFKDIKSSRYLMMIIGIIVMTMIGATFADYLLKAVAEIEFTPPGADKADKAELSAFFGKFYGRISLLSFLLQFFLSYRILKVFGVSGAILFLPVSQLLAGFGMVLYPGLLTGIFLRGSGDVFKYSIDKTARELLFLPIPLDVKKRVKVFIDVLVDRWFRGLAGAILFLFTAVMALTVSQISIVVIALSALWLVLALSIRKQYVNAFRASLDRGDIDPAELTVKITDASTVNFLVKSLESNNPRQLIYSLGILKDVQDDKLIEIVQPFLKHENNDVRTNAIEVLANQQNGNISGEIEALLQDGDASVRTAAMHYLYEHATSNRMKMMKEYLDKDDFRLRSAAVSCVAQYGTADEKVLIDRNIIDSLMDIPGEDREISRKIVARSLGFLADSQFREPLKSLMEDASPAVMREVVFAMGKTRDREYLQILMGLLSDKRCRKEARAALASYGNKILGTLNDFMNDPTVELTTRWNVPRVFMEIPTQDSVNTLVGNIQNPNPGIRHSVIRALNRLRVKYPSLTFNEEKVRTAVREEAKSYYEIFLIAHLLRKEKVAPQENDRGHLLEKALSERLSKSTERIFWLLSLIYPSKDIYNAYVGVSSNHKTLRASGIEFLENILHKSIKEFLMPMVDKVSDEDTISKAKKIFKIDIANSEDGLKHLIQRRDPWMQACAMYNADIAASGDLRALVTSARNDDSPLVRETAGLVLKGK